MTAVYAESSAVLSWLLGESHQAAVLDELTGADQVVTSVLTLIECSRALARGQATRRLNEAEELAALRLLDRAVAAWTVMGISDDVAELARAEFPQEPVRTLDALHVATARIFFEVFGSLRVLSLDDRVRVNCQALGMSVQPSP
jgi:predicted nucleic acid-binding protein